MLPRVILHSMVSVDGRTDGFPADIGLFYELAARWGEDCTLAGSETLLRAYAGTAADPEVPGEEPAARPDTSDPRPLLTVPDSRGRLRVWGRLRQEPYWRDAVALVSRATPPGYLAYLAKRQVSYIITGDDRVDMRTALEELNRRYGVRVVRVDSGGVLNGVLLRAGLVDEVSVLISPHLVGGTTPRSLFRAPDLAGPEGALPVRLVHLEERRGGVAWLRYAVVKEAPSP